MLPQPAQYLLRIDDLCPTIPRRRWQRLVALIEEFRLRPILAVIPDNRDENLLHSLPDPGFWAQMRALEAAGATIALHGHRHLCTSRGRSLLALHRRSEFAGVAEETQRAWIHEGLQILRDEGLRPRLWVAPWHGFDRQTLHALRAEGITVLSDGFARRPFLRDGLTWIPQQLWSPVEKPKGLWTICLHPNTFHRLQANHLRAFLSRFHRQFTSVDRVLAEMPATRLNPLERIGAAWTLERKRLARRLRR